MPNPTVYLPKELYEELEAERVERGLKDRAPIVQEALRHWLEKHRKRKISSRSQVRKKLKTLFADLVVPKLDKANIERLRRNKPHNPNGYKNYVLASDNPPDVIKALLKQVDDAFNETREEALQELEKENPKTEPKKKVKKKRKLTPKQERKRQRYIKELERLEREDRKKALKRRKKQQEKREQELREKQRHRRIEEGIKEKKREKEIARLNKLSKEEQLEFLEQRGCDEYDIDLVKGLAKQDEISLVEAYFDLVDSRMIRVNER